MKPIKEHLKKIGERLQKRKRVRLERFDSMTERIRDLLDIELDEDPKEHTITLRISERLLQWIRKRGKISEVIREILEAQMERQHTFSVSDEELTQFLTSWHLASGLPFAPQTEEDWRKILHSWGDAICPGADLHRVFRKEGEKGVLIEADLLFMEGFLSFLQKT